MTYTQGELLYIEWGDSATQGGWVSKEDIEGTIDGLLSKCKTVGFYVRETESAITVCQNISLTEMGEFMTISKSVITRIDRLRDNNE